MGVKDTANLAMIPAAYAENKVYSVLPSDGDGDFTFTRSGSGTRINKGGYIETMGNNVPRLNYRLDADGNVSECAELLLEESRQNIVTQSGNFSSWSTSAVSISTNQEISPDGTKSSNEIIPTSSSSSHYIFAANTSITSSTTYTLSVFAKKKELSIIQLTGNSSAFGSSQFANFDIENGSVGNYSGLASGTIPKIDNFGNGWFRCSITINSISSVTQSPIILVFVSSLTSSRLAGTSFNGTDSLYLWGAQTEIGSTVSSYIPTSGSDITRNKDSAYNQPFGDLASDYPITVFWKGRITNYNAGAFAFSVYDNGSNARYLGLAWNSSSNFYLYRRSTNNDADLVSYTTQIGDVKKIAIKFTSNTTAKVYIDGIEVYNLSSGLDVDWDFDSVLVGQQRVISDSAKRIPADELFVWNKALTDAEMVEVTSYDTFAEMATGQQFTIQ